MNQVRVHCRSVCRLYYGRKTKPEFLLHSFLHWKFTSIRNVSSHNSRMNWIYNFYLSTVCVQYFLAQPLSCNNQLMMKYLPQLWKHSLLRIIQSPHICVHPSPIVINNACIYTFYMVHFRSNTMGPCFISRSPWHVHNSKGVWLPFAQSYRCTNIVQSSRDALMVVPFCTTRTHTHKPKVIQVRESQILITRSSFIVVVVRLCTHDNWMWRLTLPAILNNLSTIQKGANNLKFIFNFWWMSRCFMFALQASLIFALLGKIVKKSSQCKRSCCIMHLTHPHFCQ